MGQDKSLRITKNTVQLATATLFSFSLSPALFLALSTTWVMELMSLSGYCLLAVYVVISLNPFRMSNGTQWFRERQSASDVAHMRVCECVHVCVGVPVCILASGASAFATAKFTLIKWAVINFNFNQKFHLDFLLIDVTRHLPTTSRRPPKINFCIAHPQRNRQQTVRERGRWHISYMFHFKLKIDTIPQDLLVIRNREISLKAILNILYWFSISMNKTVYKLGLKFI